MDRAKFLPSSRAHRRRHPLTTSATHPPTPSGRLQPSLAEGLLYLFHTSEFSILLEIFLTVSWQL